MKKKILIISSIVLVILIALWFSGIIPKQIGKIYGTKYMQENFPNMELEFVNIEWSKHYGDYIISFKDKENQKYSCVIGPKYFPISIGQGKFAIEETYKEKYDYNEIPQYVQDGIEISNGNVGEIQEPEPEKVYNYDVTKVTIEVLEDTITNKSVEILITDNNEDYFGWGEEFKVQQKVKGVWKDLNFLCGDPLLIYWNLLLYVPNKDNQIKQKLDIEKYYGTLENGIYRIVKTVGDVDIYSNEFDIK